MYYPTLRDSEDDADNRGILGDRYRAKYPVRGSCSVVDRKARGELTSLQCTDRHKETEDPKGKQVWYLYIYPQ